VCVVPGLESGSEFDGGEGSKRKREAIIGLFAIVLGEQQKTMPMVASSHGKACAPCLIGLLLRAIRD
jgi:hypothetical protein